MMFLSHGLGVVLLKKVNDICHIAGRGLSKGVTVADLNRP